MPFLQGLLTHGLLAITLSHSIPVKPDGQVHWKSLIPTTEQTPPFWQTLPEQGFEFESERKNS